MSARPILRVARVMLEAAVPLMIASGEASLTHDVLLARDPNGLPMIPAPSLAGVLRAGFAAQADDTAAKALFGDDLHAQRDPHPGLLCVGDALCLDGCGAARDGLAAPAMDDGVLALLVSIQPVLRDHVRLNAFGAVDGSGKFTRAAVPRGARFLAQLEIWDDAEEDRNWSALCEALRTSMALLRLGGATRAGYGALRVIFLETREFNMGDPTARDAARASASLAAPLAGWVEKVDTPAEDAGAYVLNLKPEGPFRFGQGAVRPEDKDPADLRPLRETVIDWGQGNAPPEITERLFIPASAVKGALRHRTAFHYQRLCGEFAGETVEAEAAVETALAPLFGHARDESEEGENTPVGTAGRVFIDDIPLPEAPPRRIARTSIDRFAGGVRRKALFTEDVIEPEGACTLRITLADKAAIQPRLVEALEHALADLAHGWLPLGAGGTKGLGVFHDPDPAPRLVELFEGRFAS